MSDLFTTLHPINDNNTDLYPNVKNENIPPVISGKDAMEALEGDFSTLKSDELQIGGENGTLINKDQIVTQSKVINLNEIVDDAELAQGLNGKVDKVSGKGLSTNDFTNADKALVVTIPNKVDKVQGKGLSTNDYTNADKTALEVTIPGELSSLRAHILNLYRMVIRSGEMITVTDASVALTSQTFPLTVSPKALLNYVGGMCQKVNQHRRVAYGSIDETTGQYRILGKESSIGLVYGHKYFVSFNAIIESDNTTILRFRLGASGYSQFMANVSNGLNQQIGELVTASGPTDDSSYFMTLSSGYTHFSYSDLRIVDLTTIYGAGNEPTSTSDARIQWLMSYLSSHPEYDAGSILTAPVTMVVSKGNVNIYYPIHPDIQALDGYGVGKDAEHYNYIDFDRKVFVKETEIDGDDIIVLAEPVETDISNLLVLSFPTYDIINVLPGGHLEFQNDNNIGVPYSVTYQSKPNTQATALTTAQPTISEVDSNDPTNPL